jgi:GAF domain-containing protein
VSSCWRANGSSLENARLLNEQREALEQQTATAEVLQVINTNPGHLEPVFDAMLDKAIHLCDATYGHFRTYDGEGFPLAAVCGPPNLVDFHLKRFAYFAPGPRNPISRFRRGERLIHIGNAAEDDAYREDPGWRELVNSGPRSVLAVALRKDTILLGYISVYRQEVRAFSDKQIALLESFAAQAVIAMENARLLTEQREALEQQTATAEVLQVINASPGHLTPVFEALLDKSMHLCQANFGALLIFDGERMKPAVLRGVPPTYSDYVMKNAISDAPETNVGRIVRGANIVDIPDLMAETAYQKGQPDRRASVELGGARTALCVALRKDETLLGMIAIYRQEVRPFSERQIALLENFAAQAVIAMENARLLTETRAALEQQTATAEVLGVINSSPGNLAPVFDAMLEKAMRLCEATFGGLWTYVGGSFHAAALRMFLSRLQNSARKT